MISESKKKKERNKNALTFISAAMIRQHFFYLFKSCGGAL